MKLLDDVRNGLRNDKGMTSISRVAYSAVDALNDAFYDKTHPDGELVNEIYERRPFAFETNGNDWAITFFDAPLFHSEEISYRDDVDDEHVVDTFFRNLECEMGNLAKLVAVVTDDKKPA